MVSKVTFIKDGKQVTVERKEGETARETALKEKEASETKENTITTKSRSKRDIVPTEVKTKVEPAVDTVVTTANPKTGESEEVIRRTPERRTEIITRPDGKVSQQVLGTSEPQRNNEAGITAAPTGFLKGTGVTSQVARGAAAALTLDPIAAQRIRAGGTRAETLGFALSQPALFVAEEGLGLALGIKRVAGVAQRSISGVSPTKAFAGSEGVAKVKSLFKTSYVPFEAKSVTNIITTGSKKIIKGTSQIKVNKDVSTSAVRGISSSVDDSTLLISKTPDGFGSKSLAQLTKAKTKGEVTQFTSVTLKGDKLKEVQRTVGISKKIGNIGKFEISEAGSLSSKIKDTFKTVKPKIVSKVNSPSSISSSREVVKIVTKTGDDGIAVALKSSLKPQIAKAVIKAAPDTAGAVSIAAVRTTRRVARSRPFSKQETKQDLEIKQQPSSIVASKINTAIKIKSDTVLKPKVDTAIKQTPVTKIRTDTAISSRVISSTPTSSSPISLGIFGGGKGFIKTVSPKLPNFKLPEGRGQQQSSISIGSSRKVIGDAPSLTAIVRGTAKQRKKRF